MSAATGTSGETEKRADLSAGPKFSFRGLDYSAAHHADDRLEVAKVGLHVLESVGRNARLYVGKHAVADALQHEGAREVVVVFHSVEVAAHVGRVDDDFSPAPAFVVIEGASVLPHAVADLAGKFFIPQ